MTIEQAIKWCESRYQGASMPGATEAYKMCLAALRAQQQAEKNEPLTLEELRGMVGKPVYIKSDGDKVGWAIVGKSTDEEDVVFIFRDTSYSLASDWYRAFGPVAYRRRPEKE